MTSKTVGSTATRHGYDASDELCWTAATTGTGCSTPTGGTTYSYDPNGNNTTVTGGTSSTWTGFNQLGSTSMSGSTVMTSTYAGTANVERMTANSTVLVTGILGQVTRTTSPPPNTSATRLAFSSLCSTAEPAITTPRTTSTPRCS